MPTTRKLSGKAKAKLVAKLTAKARRATLEAKAQFGKNPYLDKQVADFLASVVAGHYPLTCPHNGERGFDEYGNEYGPAHCELVTYGPERPFNELAEQLLFPPGLVPELLRWILEGNHQAIRNLAESVKRFHPRAVLDGDELAFTPKNPSKMALITNAVNCGSVPVSAGVIALGTGYSNTQAGRIARDVGVKPEKPGRPPKKPACTPAPKPKKPSASATKREVDEGYAFFMSKRPKRKKKG